LNDVTKYLKTIAYRVRRNKNNALSFSLQWQQTPVTFNREKFKFSYISYIKYA